MVKGEKVTHKEDWDRGGEVEGVVAAVLHSGL